MAFPQEGPRLHKVVAASDSGEAYGSSTRFIELYGDQPGIRDCTAKAFYRKGSFSGLRVQLSYAKRFSEVKLIN